jgi:hypothetical protein
MHKVAGLLLMGFFVSSSLVQAQTPKLETAQDLVNFCRDMTPAEGVRDPARASMYGFCKGIFWGFMMSNCPTNQNKFSNCRRCSAYRKASLQIRGGRYF